MMDTLTKLKPEEAKKDSDQNMLFYDYSGRNKEEV